MPLDYTDPEFKSLTLSLVKVSASVEPAMGSILFNFGGSVGGGVKELGEAGVDSLKYATPGLPPRGVVGVLRTRIGRTNTVAASRGATTTSSPFTRGKQAPRESIGAEHSPCRQDGQGKKLTRSRGTVNTSTVSCLAEQEDREA